MILFNMQVSLPWDIWDKQQLLNKYLADMN